MSSEPSSPHTIQSATGQDWVDLPALTLVARRGGLEVAEVDLGLESITVGTDESCTLCLKDSHVSRLHARIGFDDGRLVVTDLGSRNGTYMGATRLLSALWLPGQTVTVGDTSLSLREGTQGSRRVALSKAASFGQAVGATLAMRSLFSQAERAAKSDETLLCLGESGTGKEVLARAIHERSARKGGPFVVFDCGAQGTELIDSTLFGHVKGAFTGAVRDRDGVFVQADGGTLFLDEIGELPLDAQSHLLRALETRVVIPVGGQTQTKVDVRIIAATHRDLRAQVALKAFRADLLFRLSVVELHLPPLRERKSDIPLLCEQLLSQASPPRTLSDLPPHALPLLQSHHWPGNVRELRHLLARLVLLPDADLSHLGKNAPKASTAASPDLPLREARENVVEEFERSYLSALLKRERGDLARVAARAGVAESYLARLLSRHGLNA